MVAWPVALWPSSLLLRTASECGCLMRDVSGYQNTRQKAWAWGGQVSPQDDWRHKACAVIWGFNMCYAPYECLNTEVMNPGRRWQSFFMKYSARHGASLWRESHGISWRMGFKRRTSTNEGCYEKLSNISFINTTQCGTLWYYDAKKLLIYGRHSKRIYSNNPNPPVHYT